MAEQPCETERPQRRMTDAEAARRAAIVALISNGIYLGLMVALTVGVTKRDELRGLYLRARRRARGEDQAEKHDAEVRQFARAVSAWEHSPPGERV